jgi:hypothetical protein
VSTDEDLHILDVKIKQLKLDYEQYFLGNRPREPSMLRGEVQKIVLRFANTSIQNTAERFKFNSLQSRFITLKRRWDDTLRKIENGSYHRHIFKANLRERERVGAPPPTSAPAKSKGGGQKDIFDDYLKAARSCGQDTSKLTPKKLQAAVAKQEAAIKKKLGVEKVKFRVEVENGKVKLKATAVRGG